MLGSVLCKLALCALRREKNVCRLKCASNMSPPGQSRSALCEHTVVHFEASNRSMHPAKAALFCVNTQLYTVTRPADPHCPA